MPSEDIEKSLSEIDGDAIATIDEVAFKENISTKLDQIVDSPASISDDINLDPKNVTPRIKDSTPSEISKVDEARTHVFDAPKFISDELLNTETNDITQIFDVANIFGSSPIGIEQPSIVIKNNIEKISPTDIKSLSSKKEYDVSVDSVLHTQLGLKDPIKDFEIYPVPANSDNKNRKVKNQSKKKITQSKQNKVNKTVIFNRNNPKLKHLESKQNSKDEKLSTELTAREKMKDDVTVTPIKIKSQQLPVTNNEAKPSRIGLNLKHRFKLVEYIGDGGMSEVYRARDLRLEAAGIENPYIAVKILSDEFKSHPEALKVMARECQKTRELSHPNIVRVFDYDTDNNVNFITMELLEGESLDKIIQRAKPRGLSLKGVVGILEPLCKALDYAHKHRIVHADLKPSNIFLTRAGEVKIFDFGVVRALDNRDQYSADLSQLNDEPRSGGYTPAYASLEMLNGCEPDIRDDLYALGCIAYELLSSRHPYNRIPANQIKPDDIKLEPLNKIGRNQWRAIKALLSLNKENRPESALHFLQKMQKNQFALSAKITAGIFIIGATAFYANEYNHSFNTINSAHQIEIKKHQLVSDLRKSDKQSIIEQFNSISKLDEFTQLAFLQAFKADIIDYYLFELQSIKSKTDGKLPDFVTQLAMLKRIQSVYPDSFRLETKIQDILTSRTHLLQAKEYKFNNLLRQQQYQNITDEESIFNLLASMRSMKPDYQPKIDSEAMGLYGESVTSAILQYDFESIEELLKIGSIIFPEHEEYLALVQKGESYRLAAKSISLYQQSIESEEPLSFPHVQAKIFYAELIQQLSDNVTSAETNQKLDDLYNTVTHWSDKLPASFRALDDIRKQLSSSYVSKANKLIKQGKVKSASALFDRAEKLLSYN